MASWKSLFPKRLLSSTGTASGSREAAATLGQELTICFLGNSGVGKSTLINALVADGHTVVQSGGIGPLTAQAISVRYGEQPRIEVEYHGTGRLWQLLFGLESAWKSELGPPQARDDTPQKVLAEVETDASSGFESVPSRCVLSSLLPS